MMVAIPPGVGSAAAPRFPISNAIEELLNGCWRPAFLKVSTRSSSERLWYLAMSPGLGDMGLDRLDVLVYLVVAVERSDGAAYLLLCCRAERAVSQVDVMTAIFDGGRGVEVCGILSHEDDIFLRIFVHRGRTERRFEVTIFLC
jgi:hypothetical protein